MKKCRKCGVELVVDDNWYQSSKKKKTYICIKCHKERCRQRYKEKPNKNRIIICEKCGKERRLYGKGLCGKCYEEEGLSRMVICASCGEEKPHWSLGMCKKCYGRKSREDNIEDRRENNQRWREDNHEYVLKKCRQYYQDHKEEASAAHRKWRESHKEERKAYLRQWHKDHKEEQVKYRHQWYAEHREEQAEYRRQYNQDNPEVARKHNNLRRARMMNVTIEPIDEQKIYGLYGHVCIYCGSKNNLVLDHVVPLSKGGPHSEDNLVIACGSCNCSKGTKFLEEWIQRQPYSQAWVM